MEEQEFLVVFGDELAINMLQEEDLDFIARLCSKMAYEEKDELDCYYERPESYYMIGSTKYHHCDAERLCFKLSFVYAASYEEAIEEERSKYEFNKPPLSRYLAFSEDDLMPFM